MTPGGETLLFGIMDYLSIFDVDGSYERFGTGSTSMREGMCLFGRRDSGFARPEETEPTIEACTAA
jgi:hypothetical protein